MKRNLMRLASAAMAVAMTATMVSGCVKSAPEQAADTKEQTEAQQAAAPAAQHDGGDVKIGFVWPLTGGSATIGQQHNDGALMAIEEINANGGIKSMGGAKIIPVVADSETKPDVGANQVERLVTDENVSIVIGCYNSAVCFPAAEASEKLSTPFISQGGVKNEITERGYKWVFRVNNKATYDVLEMLKGIDVISEAKQMEPKTYALIYESTDWGSDNAKIWKEEADKRGWECVVDEAVTTGTSDMSSQISKIKAANPDVINVSFYTPEMIIFDKALMANKVNPPFGVWSVGGGNQDPAYFDSVDASVYDYHFVQEDWNVSMPYLYDWAGELNEKVKAEKGYGLNSFFAQGWTAAYVAYDALEAAGSSDKGAIRDALAGLELTLNEDDHTLLSGYPGLKFDENGQNTMSTGTMVQYQKGVAIPFSPTSNLLPGYSLDDIIVPIPDDFADRGKDAKPWGTPPEVRQ